MYQSRNFNEMLSLFYARRTLISICNNFTKPRIYSTFNIFRNNVRKPNQVNISQEAFNNVNTNVVKDVILYKYDNPRFFKILNIFALCQFGFWAYLSNFAFTTLKDVPVAEKTNHDVWWRNINLGEKKYRHGITIISFMLGEFHINLILSIFFWE